MKRLSCILALLLLASLCPLFASAEGAKAENLNRLCIFRGAGSFDDVSNMLDDNNRTYLTLSGYHKYFDIDFDGREVQGIYIKWRCSPGEWELDLDKGSGFEENSESILCRGDYQEFIRLPEGTKGVRLNRTEKNTSDNPFSIYDLYIYSPGELPDTVHLWQPTPSECDLMVISAHQDDELLYLGGTIPYYACEKQLDTVVVYMATCEPIRVQESLNGLWECGLRQYPVFVGLIDRKTERLEDAKEYWEPSATRTILNDLFTAKRPQVIVTQDENGEYGHGAHMLMVQLIKEAIVSSSDAGYVGTAFPGREPWEVKKCYLHLYGENQVTIPWDEMTVEALGGISAHQAAALGYEKHVSQHVWDYAVELEGKYDCRQFGLYHTAVGADEAKNDFFEHVEPRIANAVPDEAVIPVGAEKLDPDIPYLYRAPLPRGGAIDVRYGTVGGVRGWYSANEDGTLLLPARRTSFIVDYDPPALDSYDSVTHYSDNELPVYLCEDSVEAGDAVSGSDASMVTLLRYGSVDGGSPAWYAIGGDALPLDPDTPFEPLPAGAKPAPAPAASPEHRELVTAWTALIGSMALMLGFLVTLLIQKLRKKRS